ncbi:related to VPS54-subunit of VP51-54 complex, required for protein sorting at the yeast late Golgi [Fusarium proliferatum]|nr:related to VPS54-subunit of VP51-54 complex, required for protein sorting at the yeast late Golgi [Fusarium proliferatum]
MPTGRDIPPVTLTNIPHIDSAQFDSYVSQMGPLYERLQRLKESEDEPWTESKTGNFVKGRQLDDSRQTARLSAPSRNDSVSSLTSANTPFVGSYYEQASSGFNPKGHRAPSLSIVPDIYFSGDFHLENPRTFQVVSERSEVVPQNAGKANNTLAPTKPLATNAILQEKLSWYMDTVELHLIHSISMASTTFFSALGSLKELHSEAVESVEKIITLRKDLASLNQDIVVKGLELSQKRQVRRHLQLTSDAVLQLKYIMDKITYCKSLVDKGEVEKSLVELDVIESLTAGERGEVSEDEALMNFELRDIRGATALQGAANDLMALRSRAAKVFESRIHSMLINDLQRHSQSVSKQEVLLRWEAASLRAKGGYAQKPSALPTYMTQTTDLRTALMPNIHGLYRCGSMSTAIQGYRELVLREIRNVVRRSLPSSADDTESVTSASTISGGRSRTTQEKSFILAQNLRSLEAEDAEELLSGLFISIAETLRRLKTQSSLLLDIACLIENPDSADPIKSPKITSPISSSNPAGSVSMFGALEEMHVALDLPNLLSHGVNVSHEKIIKILRVRSEQTKSLPLPYFIRYYALNLFFINECEAISGQPGMSLKAIINGHTQDFIQAHGDRENQALAQGMGADLWRDTGFTPKYNGILQQILECSTIDPEAWTETSRVSAPIAQDKDDITDNAEEMISKDKLRGATIEQQTFLLPKSAILCLEGISHFLRLICGIPSLAPAIASSLVSYLQLFDSRCRQLILGADALRSAGLKNITTTHLALTFQALSFISTIIPHIREFVRRYAPANPTTEFDKVCSTFQEHQDGICQKLVEIMGSRARMLSKKSLEIDWGKEIADDVRKYMVDLIRDTSKLYKALSKRLPEEAVQLVMVRVFASCREHLGTAFKEAILETESGRDCMLSDVKHLDENFSKVNGFDDLGAYLIEIIKSKEV